MIQTESVSYPKNRWYILAILNLGLIIVMLNNLTLNVALPELSTDLNADNSELQWIMDSYVLVFGGTLLLMGALRRQIWEKRNPTYWSCNHRNFFSLDSVFC